MELKKEGKIELRLKRNKESRVYGSPASHSHRHRHRHESVKLRADGGCIHRFTILIHDSRFTIQEGTVGSVSDSLGPSQNRIRITLTTIANLVSVVCNHLTFFAHTETSVTLLQRTSDKRMPRQALYRQQKHPTQPTQRRHQIHP